MMQQPVVTVKCSTRRTGKIRSRSMLP